MLWTVLLVLLCLSPGIVSPHEELEEDDLPCIHAPCEHGVCVNQDDTDLGYRYHIKADVEQMDRHTES